MQGFQIQRLLFVKEQRHRAARKGTDLHGPCISLLVRLFFCKDHWVGEAARQREGAADIVHPVRYTLHAHAGLKGNIAHHFLASLARPRLFGLQSDFNTCCRDCGRVAVNGFGVEIRHDAGQHDGCTRKLCRKGNSAGACIGDHGARFDQTAIGKLMHPGLDRQPVDRLGRGALVVLILPLIQLNPEAVFVPVGDAQGIGLSADLRAGQDNDRIRDLHAELDANRLAHSIGCDGKGAGPSNVTQAAFDRNIGAAASIAASARHCHAAIEEHAALVVDIEVARTRRRGDVGDRACTCADRTAAWGLGGEAARTGIIKVHRSERRRRCRLCHRRRHRRGDCGKAHGTDLRTAALDHVDKWRKINVARRGHSALPSPIQPRTSR